MTGANSSVRSLTLAIVPIILLGAAIRVLGLGNTNLWGDEAFSVMTAAGPVAALLASLSTGEPHPPLYPVLLAGLERVLGRSEVIVRLPSAFAGICSIAVAAAIGRQLVGGEKPRQAAVAACLAALFVAVNPFQVWYSQEARMYELVSFFGGLASLALLQLWRGRPTSQFLYVGAVLGAAGSHYYGLFVPLAHALAVAVSARRNPPAARRWLIAVALAAGLYLPWVIYARRIFLGYYAARPGTVDLVSIAASSWVRILAGWSLTWSQATLAAAALTALAIAGVAVRAGSARESFTRLVLVSWIATPFLGGYVISLFRPLYAERYLIVCSLPLTLFVTRGISWAISSRRLVIGRPRLRPRRVVAAFRRSNWRPLAGAVSAALVFGLGFGALDNVWLGRYVKSTFNTHVQDIAALFRPNDAVILDGTSQLPLYTYYLPQPWPTYALPRQLPLDPASVAADLSQIAQSRRGAWVFLYGTADYDPSYVIPRWLTANAYPAFDDWAVTGRLQYYRFARDSDLSSQSVAIAFGNSIRLDRSAIGNGALTAGDSLPIRFLWSHPATLSGRLRVSLRLVDPLGVVWAQTDQYVGGDFATPDEWQVGQSLDDHHALRVPPGTPPGAYQVVLVVYPESGGRPLLPSGNGLVIRPVGVVLGAARVDQPSKNIWSGDLVGFRTADVSFPGSLELLDSTGTPEVAAGASDRLIVVWQALADHPSPAELRLTLVGANGTLYETRDLPLASTGYPTSLWQRGDVVREQYAFPLAVGLPAGSYSLRVVPWTNAPDDAGPAQIEVARLRVDAGPIVAPTIPPQQPLDAVLGGAIALDGFDLSPTPARTGAASHVVLHWRALSTVDQDETVFVHLLDASGKIVAQRDQSPAGGARPTSAWNVGDTILDDESVDLPPNLPAGSYSIEVGMYFAATGARLPIIASGKPAGDHLVIGTLPVVK
jgi:mannosyltransferase